MVRFLVRICLVSAVALLLIAGLQEISFAQGECGGAVACNCGDRVVEDYILENDIGPCERSDPGSETELIGLRINSGVTLDCAGYSISGPADETKESFGIKLGSSSSAVDNVLVRNCHINGFWWGAYVVNSTDIVIEDSEFSDNGWFDPTQNGTGYGVDIAHSERVTLRNSSILRNGNEGLHLTASTNVLVEDNVFDGNGFEQVYLINADGNTLRRNTTRGGTQGLEMRNANGNLFEGNQWGAAPRHWLENDNQENTFSGDHFDGVLRIGTRSKDNRFDDCAFFNPGGNCIEIYASGNAFDRPFFEACKRDVFADKPATIQRSATANRTARRRELSRELNDCSADLDGNNEVDADDLATVQAANGTQSGDALWDPAADLDRDLTVSDQDLAIVSAQQGACSDIKNRPPRLALQKTVLNKSPGLMNVRFDARNSSDNEEAILFIDFYVFDTISDTLVLHQRNTLLDEAFLEHEFSQGKYMIYATATDRFGANTQPKKRGLTVK